MRERIGAPSIQPVAEIRPYALEEAVDNLLALLAAHNITVDFLGEWDDQAAYRFITEEWAQLPATNQVDVKPIAMQAAEEEGTVRREI